MYFLGAIVLICSTFPSNGLIQNNPLLNRAIHTPTHARPPTSLLAKLWQRMEIEDDDEPMWYLLNSVAGSEIDLLRQCMQLAENMEDIEKLVVPTVTSTRSHGPNRMVTDTKVTYQGYVFAKLRLCEETYEAIQGLDLCRSWMGTINQKGYKKLPPSPVALSDDEIENFGLELIEELKEDDADSGVIVDTEDEDKATVAAAAIEEEVKTTYVGLKVGDMIKVTAKGKFFDEDGIVKRLKGEKVMIRFFTYGSMYEQWLDPSDVRKLSDEEVIDGLGGPSQPITQQDIDEPKSSGRDDYGETRGDSRRNLPGAMGGDRNRRQDRTAGQFRQEDSLQDRNKERKNWDWYKDNERRSRDGAYADGEFDMRGSSAQGDVDAQWGRGPPQKSRDGPQKNRERQANSGGGGDDWSSFVSQPSSSPSKSETDDFFDSLMTDLSKDLESEGSGDSFESSGGSDEDDFFASLMSEIADDEETRSSSKKSKPAKSSAPSDGDDFFASLEKELQGATDNKPTKTKEPSTNDDLDDFFSEIGSSFEKRDETPDTSDGDDADDFFADLEAELEAELASFVPDAPAEEIATPAVEEASTPEPIVSKKKSATSSSSSPNLHNPDLQKCTVPALKDMLRDRGLKVSGKKSELIERLVS